ncbi:MAG: [FeFe] hydrogenase H-cluster radical SAM maturase HydE [Clostridiales bacterium]|nr:[FeFe] hydrogenase H-cluster radical SAM maturase HydE [Clostridiales bacterium]
MAKVIKLIEKLEADHFLTKEEFHLLIKDISDADLLYLRERACIASRKYFSNKIYIRGLIEFTNYCKNDCFYCGIRRSNHNVLRYRLSKEDILQCAQTGYSLGFRTFVLQGGEDSYYTDDYIVDLIKSLKDQYPDCAITLSIGEKSYDSYRRFFEAGADRYLLRHETANEEHYQKIHPPQLSIQNRKQCLWNLKEIGYQVGAGIMIGSPYQTVENLVEDLLFLKDLSPHMVGIGPFIPHHQTPFAKEASGSLRQTLLLLSIIRLMLPGVLLPATTALGSIHPEGREMGILSGANVVMPNLSPTSVRKKYELYDNKICTGDEAAECRYCLEGRLNRIGYQLTVDRGDHKPII